MGPSEIEKQNLEAHVEICSERYGYLEDNISRVESRLTVIEQRLDEIRRNLETEDKNRYKSMWNYSGAIIAVLIGIVITLLIAMWQSGAS